MSNQHIIRAWKDPGYRNSLSQAELAALPANPAGAIEIADEDLGKVAAGATRRPPQDTNYCSFLCTATCTDCGSICCPSLQCPSYWCTICGPIHPQ